MVIPHFQALYTKRLFLRALNTSDWDSVLFLRSNPAVNQFIKRAPTDTKEKALQFISKIKHGLESQTLFHWVISTKENNDMIGSICLWNFSADHKEAEVGYDLKPEFQGKGIMTETLLEIIRFGFEKLNLNTIDAYTSRHNEPSKKLLLSNGFTLVEGKKDIDNADNSIYRTTNPAKNTLSRTV